MFSKTAEDKESEINSLLDALNLPEMTEEQNNTLGAEITIAEIQGAIKSLKKQRITGD